MTSPVFDEDDQMFVLSAAITDVTGTAGGTYTATEQTLINSLKTQLNLALAALRKANIIAED